MIERILTCPQRPQGSMTGALVAPIDFQSRPKSVGPFVVVAHILPNRVGAGTLAVDEDVRPHPHIGLAAITYLIDGWITHRDSLGSRQELSAGGLAYMVAGRGVVHSERMDRLRVLGGPFELVQILLALPDGHEDVAPSFCHVPAERIPTASKAGAVVRTLFGAAPDIDPRLRFPSAMFLEEVRFDPQGRYEPPGHRERAVYVLRGAVDVDGSRLEAQQVALLAPGDATVTAEDRARILVFGGDPVGPRYSWWNYIHSSPDRIEAAKAAWRAREVPLPPGDTESFTPAPADDGRPQHLVNAPELR